MPNVTTNPDGLFQTAMQHHQAGHLAEAEQLYRQILAQQPNHADSIHMLGVLAIQAGRNELAMDLIRQAIALRSNFAEAHNSLGNALKAKGQPDQAITAFRQAIALRPNYPEAHYNLANALYDKRQLDEAIAAYRQAIALRPNFAGAQYNLGNALFDKGQLDQAIAAYRQAIALKANFAEAHNNLGNALYHQGQLDEAVAAYRQAIALKRDYPEAYSNLGNALKDRGQPDEAIAAYRQGIALRPNDAEALSNLGILFHHTGQLDEAIATYRQAIALKPDLPEVHSNLGNALYDNGQLDEAVAACRQAIALRPNFPDAHYNLGNALTGKNLLDEAITAYRQAIALKPDFPKAQTNLGNALKFKGQLDDAIAAYRQAIALKPDLPEVHSNLVLTLNYHPELDAAAVAEEAGRWNHQHAEQLAKDIAPHRNERTPGRRLRIGYVSLDFRQHAVAHFLLPLLAHHDHQRCEIFCYAQVLAPDAVTQQLRSHADHWHSLIGLTDQQAAELIRSHQIDILVDLAGHTAHNRLLLFARKPAPIQVTYLGYPGSTGLTTIDYRLTDPFADPPGLTETFHSEELLRLPTCAWCYDPIESPAIAPRPERPITFGCFNNFSKVTEPMLQLWARILQTVPDSALLLKGVALSEGSTCQHVRDLMQSHGIAPARLELLGRKASHADHLAAYNQMDIALDTFPYHGTTTTCEALWMGVPVLSLAGQSHVSRVGVSLLSNAGLPEFIALTPDQYFQIAAGLASDPARLAELRATLRQRMQQSPLMDAPRFARDIEAAYRNIWTHWCREGW